MRVLCIKYTCALCKHFKYAVLKRYSSNETVRVRFAPSPTGTC